MKKPAKRRRWLFLTVAVVGVALVAVLTYFLCPPLRGCAVSLLEGVGADDSLVGMLSDPDHEVRDAASAALVRRGPRAVPALARGVERSDLQGRIFALSTLQRIGPPARDAFAGIHNSAKGDPDAGVRGAAIPALAVVGDGDPETVGALVGLLESGDEDGRQAAARALGEHPKCKVAEAVAALARRLKDPSAKVREVAADTLGAMAPASAPAVPALVESLSDPHPLVRTEAAEALGNLAAFARSAVPGLMTALSDPDSKVRSEAAEAIEKIIDHWGEGEGEAALRQQAIEALKRTGH